MRTFFEFIQSKYDTGEGLLQHLDKVFDHIDQYDNSVQGLLADLSRDHGPVEHAYNKYKSALDTLRQTISTAMQKDLENPERGDHPPRSINDDPRDA